MRDQLKKFEHQQPEIIFSWNDSETEAKGWVVINSLRNGGAGGGTRMRKGCTLEEVISLAKTMEIKFSVCGPPIGGAKSGIDFDPEDPRKHGVLERWYKAVRPLLKYYYGTGGDLNVDEVADVIPITSSLGILHPQEGIVNGHIQPTPEARENILRQLSTGVTKRVTHNDYAPTTDAKTITVSDMVTGFGVGMAVVHFYKIWGIPMEGKRVIVQGFGNVGGAAALTLAKEGFKIAGIIDRSGGIIREEGLTLPEVKHLYLHREGNKLAVENAIPFEKINNYIWSAGAEVFIPAAGSRLVTKYQLDEMRENGLEVISCGANVPFNDPDIFLGETGLYADTHVAVIPDFIANCGMARTFAYLMQENTSLEDEKIFEDISLTIEKALRRTFEKNPFPRELWQNSLDWVLEDILKSPN
ncbi:MAG: Glu/Leu/Phe/Val dehydrogenase dimerization domain-containing protein [Bacteroidia bacterium]